MSTNEIEKIIKDASAAYQRLLDDIRVDITKQSLTNNDQEDARKTNS